jgi:hypothetical protein
MNGEKNGPLPTQFQSLTILLTTDSAQLPSHRLRSVNQKNTKPQTPVKRIPSHRLRSVNQKNTKPQTPLSQSKEYQATDSAQSIKRILSSAVYKVDGYFFINLIKPISTLTLPMFNISPHPVAFNATCFCPVPINLIMCLRKGCVCQGFTCFARKFDTFLLSMLIPSSTSG